MGLAIASGVDAIAPSLLMGMEQAIALYLVSWHTLIGGLAFSGAQVV